MLVPELEHCLKNCAKKTRNFNNFKSESNKSSQNVQPMKQIKTKLKINNKFMF